MRPSLNVRNWIWKDKARNETPGIGLLTWAGQLKAHLTPDEARALADKLHDMADQMDGAA